MVEEGTHSGPGKRAQVLRIWDDGERDRHVIAETVGVEVSTVTVWLSRAKRLRHDPTENYRYYRVWAPSNLDKVAAERYSCRGSALLRRLVETIDKDDLYAAVLDDKVKPPSPE